MKKILFALLCMACVSITLASCGKKSDDKAPTAVAENNEPVAAGQEAVVAEEGLQVIDFYATWCGPCKKLAPVFEKLEKKYAGKISFARVDIDVNGELTEKYNVSAVPTLVFLKDGEVKDVSVGLLSEKQLDAKLAEFAEE